MAVGGVRGGQAVEREFDRLGVSCGTPNTHRIERSGRTQRNASERADAAPQRIDFGHGKRFRIPAESRR